MLERPNIVSELHDCTNLKTNVISLFFKIQKQYVLSLMQGYTIMACEKFKGDEILEN